MRSLSGKGVQASIIKRSEEFTRAFKEGKYFNSKSFSVYKMDSPCLEFGFAVSRKVGNSVKRNFVKRRLREIVSKKIILFPTRGRLVFLGKREILRSKFSELEIEFLNLLTKLS